MADIEEKIKDKKIVFPKITLADLLKGMLLRRREEMANVPVTLYERYGVSPTGISAQIELDSSKA